MIDPKPIPDLNWVKASVRLPTGELVSGWERKDGHLTLRVTVPASVEAQVLLPTGRETVMGPATRSWACKIRSRWRD